jgi:surface antigen
MRGTALKWLSLVALVAILTPACAGIGAGVGANPKTTVGAMGGGALGGLIAAAAGGKGTAIAAGVVGGALLGGLAGNLLDQRDKRLAGEAAQRALETAPSGAAVAWQNPDTGHSGTVVPVKTYQADSGTYCREYQNTMTINGKKENSYGTACRQPDGSWKVVSQ